MALSAFATKLQLGNAATPEVFSNVAEITDMSGPSLARDSIETTNHQSTSRYRQFMPGLRDGGEVTFSVNFDPSLGTHDELTGLIAQYNDDVTHNYRIVYPQSDVEGWSLTGFITKFEVKNPIDDKISGDITIKVTGKPTWGTF